MPGRRDASSALAGSASLRSQPFVDAGEHEARPPELPASTYRMLIERAQIAMFVAQHGRFRFVNARLCQLFGLSRRELMEDIGPFGLVVPESRAAAEEEMRQRLAGVEGRPYDIRCLRKDGTVFHARVWGSRIELDGEAANLVTLHDTSELERALSAEQRRSRLLAQTEELVLMGSSEYDVASGAVTQSAGMFRVFGEPFSEAPVSGEWLMERVPASEDGFVRGILAGVRPGEPCEFEHRIRHRNGSLRTVLHRASAEVDANGNAVRVIGIVQDITAQRVAEHQRDTLAHIDSVTRLPNRAALLDQVDIAIRQALRQEREVALVMVEIGQLQLVSESLGFAAGDELLMRAAESLSACLSIDDMLAHLGMGRYALLLSGPRIAAPSRSGRDRFTRPAELHELGACGAGGVNEAAALRVADVVVAAFDEPLPVGEIEVMVRCAIGISFSPRDAQSADVLLHQAEAAMRRAQEDGVNRVSVYAGEAHARAATRLALEAGLRRALERNEFRLVYQPQVDLTSGALIGVEALLRWDDPKRGLVSPVDFIPLAEETGLIVPIGEWVLRAACRQAVAWQREALAPLRMAVNLSVCQLQQPDIAARVEAILAETGLAPQHLGLEITESVMMQNHAHVVRTLEALQRLGIEISLDDFGTGYSNLSYLRTLPIDVVKIDRSLVHDVTAAPQDVSMTRAVITMAHNLRKKVLAEGVETEGQLALLIANRCDQMQGYYFSRPVAPELVADMLRERRCVPERLLQRRGAKRTLLLVDDNDDVVAALKRLLRHDGYTIVSASSGAQGLQRLAEHPVDVILSGQRMTGISGVEFLRRARELHPDTVRMVLSGCTELQSLTDAIDEGAIHKFLTQPWDDARLRSHIAEAFENKEMADENRRLGDAVRLAECELDAANVQLAQLQERLRGHEPRQNVEHVA